MMIRTFTKDVAELVRSVEQPMLKQKAKEVAVATGLALGIFASYKLAYLTPYTYAFTFATTCLLGIQTLSLAIQSERVGLIKAALATYFISFNCLALGGLSAYLVHQTPAVCKQLLERHRLGSFIASMFVLTAIVGHLMPICTQSLKKLFSILEQSQWESSLEQMRKEWKEISNEIANPLLRRWEQVSAYLYLLLPQETFEWLVHLSIIFTIPLSRQGFLLREIFSSSNFQQFINEIKDYSNELEIPAISKLVIYGQIKYKMHLIPESSMEQELNFLLDQVKWLIPKWMTPIQFLGLIQGRFLENINTRIALDANKEVKIADLHELESDLTTKLQKFNEDYKNAIASEDALKELQEISHDLNNLKKQIEILGLEVNRISIYSSLSTKASRSGLLKSEVELNASPLSLLQKSCYALSKQVEDLNTKFYSQRSIPVGPVQFLGANKCEFKYEDYLLLKDMFNLDELDEEELDKKLSEVGLDSEEDFYKHNILSRSSNTNKKQIHLNLQKFITGNSVPINLSNTTEQTPPSAFVVKLEGVRIYLKKLNRKVSKLIYKLITKGLILVPCIIHPKPALIGLGLGCIYFSLRKFGVFQEFADYTNRLKRQFPPLGLASYLVLRRRLLFTTQVIQQNAEWFGHSNILRKVAMINREIFATIIIDETPLISDVITPLSIIGPFSQGVVLSEEIVDHFSTL